VRAVLALCALLALLAPLPAVPDALLEAWFLYEQGKAKMASPGELGEALLLFAQAIDKRGGNFPEAEVAVGDVYRAEGAYVLAEQRYSKAWELRAGFEIAEEKYVVLYRLAELAEAQQRYADLEKHLARLLEDQPYHSGAQHAGLRESMRRSYLERGLDQTFRLYRMDGVSFAASAHSRLGWLLYRTGRYDSGSASAVMHLLFALDIAVTEAVAELRRAQPDYVYTTLQDFLERAAKRPNIAAYLTDCGFVHDLYYLAAATWAAAGHPTRADGLWRTVAALDPAIAGEFAQLSRRQLASPWVEPYLTTASPRSIAYPQRKP